jgi:hypothetical protein
MPQALNLTGGGSDTLLVHRHTRMLLHAYPVGVVLKVEQILRVRGQRTHPSVEVRALEVGHCLKTLLSYRVLLISNREKRDSSATVVVRRCLHKEVRVMYVISSTPVSGSLPMMDPDHNTVWLKDIVTLTSH